MHHDLKPGDMIRQSIPFSYMSFTAKSLDGASHAVQVYSDVGGRTCNSSLKPVVPHNIIIEWNSGDPWKEIWWNTTYTADVIYHNVSLQTQIMFTESLGEAVWGTLYFAMQTVSDTNLSAFLLTVHGAGSQCHLQGRGRYGLSQSFCAQRSVRQPRRASLRPH